jgi:hypothetical protein
MLNSSYTRPASRQASSHFNIGPMVAYKTPAGIQVAGGVHYFLDMTQWTRRAVTFHNRSDLVDLIQL